MKQLLPLFLILASTSVLIFRHSVNLRSTQAELAQSRMEQIGLRSTIDDLERNTLELTRKNDERRSNLAAVSAELEEISATARRSQPEHNRLSEGSWPDGKPYFYLSKGLLNQIGFAVLGANGQPTVEATKLLGMTPQERNEFGQAWEEFHFGLQELQARSAKPLPNTDGSTDPNKRSVGFRLGDFSAGLKDLRSKLDFQIEAKLGATRAGILSPHLNQHIDDVAPPFGVDESLVSFQAERQADGSVRHQLQFESSDRSSKTFHPVYFAEDGTLGTDENSALWNYRHLFGDKPLLFP